MGSNFCHKRSYPIALATNITAHIISSKNHNATSVPSTIVGAGDCKSIEAALNRTSDVPLTYSHTICSTIGFPDQRRDRISILSADNTTDDPKAR